MRQCKPSLVAQMRERWQAVTAAKGNLLASPCEQKNNKEEKKMKWIYRLNLRQLEAMKIMWTKYLHMHLADSDRCKVRENIKNDYKILNAIKLAIKEKIA